MKKIITILFLTILSTVSYSQDTIKQQKVVQESNIKNDNLTKNELLDIKNDIITIKDEINNKSSEFKESRTNLFTKYFELWAFIGLILGFFGLRKFTVEEIKSKVSEQISDFTRIEKEYIKKNLIEFRKHTNLKKASKILLINQKGTKYPDSFKRILDLFYVDYLGEDLLEIDKLCELNQIENIEKSKKYDLVIIENQISSNEWFIKSKNLIEKEVLTEDENKRNEFVKEGNKLVNENKYHLIDFADKICDKTAILYYAEAGTGFFPTKEVKEENQHFITFANAPSQLYGNMLNMLKYKSEIES